MINSVNNQQLFDAIERARLEHHRTKLDHYTINSYPVDGKLGHVEIRCRNYDAVSSLITKVTHRGYTVYATDDPLTIILAKSD